MIRALPCSALLVLLAISTAFAGNWPEFRGPTGQGISTAKNVPVEFGPEKNVVWRTEISGDGWSSPVLWNGKLFLTAATLPEGESGNARELRTLCYDAKSGKLLWNVKCFEQADAGSRIHPKNSHASPTPITDGRHLWVHFGTKGTACLTLDGDFVWKTTELKYAPQHGNGGSPILVGDLLFVSCDGRDVQFVVALDRRTGKIRWKKDRPTFGESNPFSFSTALAIEVDGRTQIISPASDKVVAYDAESGEEIWFSRYTGYSVIPRPVLAHGHVFFSTSYNRPSFYAVRIGGKGDVTESHVAWSTNRAAPHTPSPVVVGDQLYMVSDRGVATCVDAKTGEVRWQERIGGNFSASPIVAEGRIYLTAEDGKVTVVKAAPEYEVLATNVMGERTLASPAVDEGTLYIRTAAALYRIGQ